VVSCPEFMDMGIPKQHRAQSPGCQGLIDPPFEIGKIIVGISSL